MNPLSFDGVLFFPITPFAEKGGIDRDTLAMHLHSSLRHRPGGVFPACGTGEFHALSADEASTVVAAAVEVVAGAAPVIAGVGGPLAGAIAGACAAADAGADGLLILPPYLVAGPQSGLLAYVEAVAAASPLPVIPYHRATSRFHPDTVARLFENEKVVGLKDGVGDLALAGEFARIARRSGRVLHLFNGLLTAELTQVAYAAAGVPLYSSAAFAAAPEVSTAFYRAYGRDDRATMDRLLESFFQPWARLRDETLGFGVSLVKAALRLRGVSVGSVRPPLIDPDAAQTSRLESVLAAGHAAASRAA